MKNIYICFIIHLYVSVIMSCVIFASDEKNIFDTFLQKIKDKSKTELGKKNSHLIEQKNASMKWLLEIFKEYRTFVQITNIKKNNLLEVVNKFNTFNSQIQNTIKILQNKISDISLREKTNKPNQKKTKKPHPDFMVLFYLEKISSRGIFFKLVKEDKLDLLKPIFDQLIDQKKIEKNNASIETLKSFIANAKIDGQASFIEENIKDNTAKNVMLNVVIASYFENNHSLNFSYNTLPKKVQLIRNRFRASNSQNFSDMTINREKNTYTIPGYGVISQTELLFFDLEGGGDIIQGFCVSLEKYKELLSKTNDESQLQSLKKRVQIIEEVRKSLPVKKTAEKALLKKNDKDREDNEEGFYDFDRESENDFIMNNPKLFPNEVLDSKAVDSKTSVIFTEPDKNIVLPKDAESEDKDTFHDFDPALEKEFITNNPEFFPNEVLDSKAVDSKTSVIFTEPDKNIVLPKDTESEDKDTFHDFDPALENDFIMNNPESFSNQVLDSKKIEIQNESKGAVSSVEVVKDGNVTPSFVPSMPLPAISTKPDEHNKREDIFKKNIDLLEKNTNNSNRSTLLEEVYVQSSIEEKSNQKSLLSYKSLLTFIFKFGSLIYNNFISLSRKFW